MDGIEETGSPVLALDTGSPLVSVAVGTRERILGAGEIEIARSSEHLLQLIDDALATAGLELGGLAGVVVLRGPGSFTGLRVGLASALAFHQALRLPVLTLPTLEVLAAAADPAPGARCLALVNALRGEWFAQPFAGHREIGLQAAGEVERLPVDSLASQEPATTLVGFGVESLLQEGWPATLRLLEPGPLAPHAVRLAYESARDWDPDLLTAPLYLRPPAATPPRRSA